jgi:hypothetical protein
MIVQDQLDRNLLPAGRAQPGLTVAQGAGTVSLVNSIPIPTSGVSSVTVRFALYPGLSVRANALATVSYPVG